MERAILTLATAKLYTGCFGVGSSSMKERFLVGGRGYNCRVLTDYLLIIKIVYIDYSTKLPLQDIARLQGFVKWDQFMDIAEFMISGWFSSKFSGLAY